MKRICLVVTVLFCVGAQASNLMYPELNVAPKASERLKIEENLEKGEDWISHLPIQISALTTFVVAGQVSSAKLDPDLDSDEKKIEEDKQSTYAMLGRVVGGFWLGATIWATLKYRPYHEANVRVAGMKGSSQREMLTKERLAEEELNALRRLGRRMRWASVGTNLIIAGLSSGIKYDEEESSANTYTMISGLTSLLPLFFKYRWEEVANEQDKYKKRIFSPVAYSPIVLDPFTATNRAAGFNLVFAF